MKKKNYFDEQEEAALRKYLDIETPSKDKAALFYNILYPALENLVEGVINMPKFHSLINITKDQLKAYGFEKVIVEMHKFDPNKVSKKTGEQVKAYSFFSTVAKNEMVQRNKKANKVGKMFDDSVIIENQADVYKTSQAVTFEQLINECIEQIENRMRDENFSEEKKAFANELIALLKDWHNLEFDNKFEFREILHGKLGLSSLQVLKYLKEMKIKIFR